MVDNSDLAVKQQREQVFKLVAKAFYRELANYGVADSEVLSVANHLLDNVVRGSPDDGAVQPTHSKLTIGTVVDEWRQRQVIHVDNVSIRPLQRDEVGLVADWLQAPEVRANFVPVLPGERTAILDYFHAGGRDYFGICHDDRFVGIVGAENIDAVHRKLEMKKLVGAPALQGKGIGTRATFAFLYHAFRVRGMHKVYVHSRDTNVRNLNLNSRLGFELEGIFLEEFRVGERQVDVVRMGLLEPIWTALFGD